MSPKSTRRAAAIHGIALIPRNATGGRHFDNATIDISPHRDTNEPRDNYARSDFPSSEDARTKDYGTLVRNLLREASVSNLRSNKRPGDQYADNAHDPQTGATPWTSSRCAPDLLRHSCRTEWVSLESAPRLWPHNRRRQIALACHRRRVLATPFPRIVHGRNVTPSLRS
jgi:hypothetical protein